MIPWQFVAEPAVAVAAEPEAEADAPAPLKKEKKGFGIGVAATPCKTRKIENQTKIINLTEY